MMDRRGSTRAFEQGPAWASLRAWMLIALLSPLGLGVGCGDDDEFAAPAPAAPEAAAEAEEAPAPSRRARAKAKKKAPAPDLEGGIPEVQEDEELTYSYSSVGKRDPFIPFLKSAPTMNTDIVGPLQKYDISQYKLVGIVWGTAESTAMVEDPEKNGHFVRIGTLIGKNWGKVARINPNNVVVAEEYRDFQGRLVVNEIVMELPQL